ncbi:MAG: 3-isopropylmalate dehydratase small subunit [Gloeomargarita sp. SKYBB_i_bin120]|nr:3-isopropylmalate dehydratase small subunit [Gloeomargarita sp. SKYG98]MCS7292873.1 3-isopropylmalate dehydratase small subunit [Gloeomargarita sp. SKYB120]MDW8178436.1 3-isopropylmalate dehydratase small subunit [Gloeomargarita sp. SKYBB_i_bin120]
MTPIQRITGRALPLVGHDIDTDRIIPARFLRCVTFDGLGAHVFADDRARGDHPFDQPQYQGATILVVNANFGCGSSREHAPQALRRWGIRAIVGESFAEIFAGNCLALGLPVATAPPDVIQFLQAHIATDPSQVFTLDLERLTLATGTQTWSVQMEPRAQRALLQGTWDACGQLLANREAILATAARLDRHAKIAYSRRKDL